MKLKKEIESRLKKAGFDEKQGADAPFFVLGDFANNALTVDVYGPHTTSIVDKTIAAVNAPVRVDGGEFVLHAVTNKKSLRVKGKPIFKNSMAFVFKFNVIEEAE